MRKYNFLHMFRSLRVLIWIGVFFLLVAMGFLYEVDSLYRIIVATLGVIFISYSIFKVRSYAKLYQENRNNIVTANVIDAYFNKNAHFITIVYKYEGETFSDEFSVNKNIAFNWRFKLGDEIKVIVVKSNPKRYFVKEIIERT